MEWNWRTFIIIFGLMLVVGIVVDGLRRMRRNRELALRLDVNDYSNAFNNFDNPELPNGGWRLANEEPTGEEPINDDSIVFNDIELTTVEAEPDEEADLAYIQGLVGKPEDYQAQPKVESRPVNLDEQVPLLLEVEELGEDIMIEDIELIEEDIELIEDIEEAKTLDEVTTSEAVVEVPAPAPEQPAATLNPQELISPVNFAHADAEQLKDRPATELTLVIHCITPIGNSLDGKQLAQLFNGCDLRLGPDGIFHRYEQPEGKGNIQFSVVHSYEPQYFDVDKLLEQTFHGFSFFMRLPGPKEPLQAYETMLGLAKFIEQQFEADLYDADRSALTQQTIEHDRQQIIDFERRQQVAAKKLMRG